MGVPTFYKWLSTKFPKVVQDVVEKKNDLTEEGVFVPPDLTAPNPNGMEFDCLYLDMNGIIHPCCHPEGGETPSTEDAMFRNIFDYIDRMFNVCRPRKLLYMAIDGVAPRAKMNQQRMRRFKAAADMALEEDYYEELKAQFQKDGRPCPPPKTHWDHNVITPGTPFMFRLANALRYYVQERMANDPAWKSIKVVLSDGNCPGEGEHKIMQYIRDQRQLEDYDPNMRHVLHGMDADLIMLGLSTHEAHFYIVRETITMGGPGDDKCYLCGKSGHQARDCTAKEEADKTISDQILMSGDSTLSKAEAERLAIRSTWKPLQFLRLPVLREYLANVFSFQGVQLKIPYDLERCIDDFVLMCFFVGNDFLPHLPSLSIHKGSIDQMLLLYQKILPEMDDYLTNAGKLHVPQVTKFLSYLSKIEAAVFVADNERKDRMKRRRQEDARRAEGGANDPRRGGGGGGGRSWHDQGRPPPRNVVVFHPLGSQPPQPPPPQCHPTQPAAPVLNEANDAAALALKSALLSVADSSPESGSGKRSRERSVDNTQGAKRPKVTDADSRPTSTGGGGLSNNDDFEPPSESSGADFENTRTKRTYTHQENVDDFRAQLSEKLKSAREIEDPEDEVKLGIGDESEWRPRYYHLKFHLHEDDDIEEFATRVATAYAVGLAWVLRYYYQGVASWEWYYPFHYAPFATDIFRLGLAPSANVDFQLGRPFKPFWQLMAVLPARSGHCLPRAFARHMKDAKSPIIDFYPKKFKEDPDGKKFKWQWVVLLPFIDQARLVETLRPEEENLTQIEKVRNGGGRELLFVSKTHPLASELDSMYKCWKDGTPQDETIRDMELSLSDGMGGKVKVVEFAETPGDIVNAAVDGVASFESESFYCEYVPLPKAPHVCRLLSKCTPPMNELTAADFEEDPQRDRRFNAATAKRLILGAIGGESAVSGHNRQMGHPGSGHDGRRNHDVYSVNRYQSEVYHHATPYAHHPPQPPPMMYHQAYGGYQQQPPPPFLSQAIQNIMYNAVRPNVMPQQHSANFYQQPQRHDSRGGYHHSNYGGYHHNHDSQRRTHNGGGYRR